MECAYYFDFCRLYPPLLAPIKSCPLSLLALQKGEGWRSRGEGSSSVRWQCVGFAQGVELG